MRVVSVKMPDALIDGVDELVRRGFYRNKSEAMRMAVRSLLKKELWNAEEEE
ncbi:MAG: ribbon-helix-helix domain-containing protein [Metallosphaera sp.]